MTSKTNNDVTRLIAGAMGLFDTLTDLTGLNIEKDDPQVVEYTLASDLRIGQQIVLPSGEFTHVASISGDQDVVEVEFATGDYFDFLSNGQVRTK